MEFNCVLCVVQVNLVSIQHALSCQSERKPSCTICTTFSKYQRSEAANQRGKLHPCVNYTLSQLPISWLLYNLFVYSKFLSSLDHVMLSACTLLLFVDYSHYPYGTILTSHYRFCIWWLVEQSSGSI